MGTSRPHPERSRDSLSPSLLSSSVLFSPVQYFFSSKFAQLEQLADLPICPQFADYLEGVPIFHWPLIK
jgi:hypothetical protein